MSESNLQQEQFTNAKRWLKVQGILSIIFGALGTLFAAPVTFFYAIGASYDLDASVGPVVFVLMCVLGFVFWLLPHIFLIVSGSIMVRMPKPSIAKGLSITNIVIGAFWNYIILAFAIVSLVQSGNYSKGYVHHK